VSRHSGRLTLELRPGLAALLALTVVLLVRPVLAQTPAPVPPPDPPPPRLEASGQFAFLNTSGNADTQSLGAGGELISRPDPWTYRAKLVFAQTETDDELSARSFAGLFRGSRALNSILSLELSHTIRYSAAPPEGFEKTDTIMAVSLVAKVQRPR
jgi:putative salt-induced outer membrane protein YdiY